MPSSGKISIFGVTVIGLAIHVAAGNTALAGTTCMDSAQPGRAGYCPPHVSNARVARPTLS